MPILKCRVNTCTYFYDQRCSKTVIKVTTNGAVEEKDTHCASYHKKDRTAYDDYNLEIATLDNVISDYLSINCDVQNCIYNRNELCYAKDVKIDGAKAKGYRDTFCSSFVNK